MEETIVIDLAIEVAAKAHRTQIRKGTDIPYISHPFAVGLLLAREGCSDEVVAAAILHDTVEDTPITLDYVRQIFGEKVASIVDGCSEPNRHLPWEDRKKHTLEYLRTAPAEVRMVACADKLHNMRAIASDWRRIGDEVWKRFKRGKKEQEWYYRGLVDSLCNHSAPEEGLALFQEFKEEVENLFGKQ
ncbi:MAG: bifunctional (p)ppGpp synthetase/guanosine-3',5'-bis(diphosphate) 3'-pyrophosphohydrolase [Armatimonadetes bacterium]|nr:bifunctional (p)ppGpp synthetase/guanosine-3',5'-bis(diphosphate) 3'-pyrophosphohydrolase [Armatimonadota bacterium]